MEKKTNREKFKELTREKKLEYIWDYYRWHIVGVILGIFVVWQAVTIITAPPAPVYSTDIVVAGSVGTEQGVYEETVARYNTELDANIQVMPVNWESMDQSMFATEQLFMLKMMVSELDVAAVGQAKFDKFQLAETNEILMPLETIPELEEVLKDNEDKLMRYVSKIDGKEHIFGIKVDRINNMEGLLMGEELVICISSGVKNIDSAVNIMKYLLE